MCEKYGPSTNWESAIKGVEALVDDRNQWSKILADKSLQADYAIIGATWVVHGSEISSNVLAVLSVFFAVLHIGVYLFFGWLMYSLLDKRLDFALGSADKWDKEYRTSADPSNHWPYSYGIDRLGELHNHLKMIIPLSAAIFWSASIWLKYFSN